MRCHLKGMCYSFNVNTILYKITFGFTKKYLLSLFLLEDCGFWYLILALNSCEINVFMFDESKSEARVKIHRERLPTKHNRNAYR